MQNNNSQIHNQKTKGWRRDLITQLFHSKRESLFSKLSSKSLSYISSFLTLRQFNRLLLVSKGTYQLFSQSSGCYQIECHRLLNIKCDLILSQNWKRIVQSVICIPIRGLPYGEAIKSIRHEQRQYQILLENKINYSPFQKSILYFENQFNTSQKQFTSRDFQEAKLFGLQNTDIILKLRQGQEIHIQLPSLLMLIYNLHDYIKIYSLYLETRFIKCGLEEFNQLWLHFAGWISTVEFSTMELIKQFNEILDESLPQYKLPKYTIRNFMVGQWMMKADKGQLIVNLREDFKFKMIKCRQKNIKIRALRDYVQYLVDTSTNQQNIQNYGYYSFMYCEEMNYLIKMAVDLTLKMNINYQEDEAMLQYIFGEYIYNHHIFERLIQFRTDQFKYEIRSHQQECQNSSKIVPKNFEDTTLSLSFGNDSTNFKLYISSHYNVQIRLRALFKQISLMEDEITAPQENQINESLGTSGVSLTSTNCSSIMSSIRNNDQLYNYIKHYQKDLFNSIVSFYQKQDEVYQLSQEIEPEDETNYYDVPELCEYHQLQYVQLMELLQSRIRRSQVILQQEKRRTTMMISSNESHSAYLGQQSTAQLLICRLSK